MTAAAARGAEETRRRVVEAALACVERQGLVKTSLEDVASEAGLSRATVYRHFPGGRDEVITETVAYEIGRFLERVGAEVDAVTGVEAKLGRALTAGHRAIADHHLMQQVLSTEPEALLLELAGAGPQLHCMIQDEIARHLVGSDLRPGTDVTEAADYIARLFLSYIGSPGAVDLDDPAAVERVVSIELLGGILRPPADPR